MDAVPRVSAVAALIAEPARARMLSALMSGDPMTATELALQARVTAQTASSHLAGLREAGLLALEKRCEIITTGSPALAVAEAMESLQVLAADGIQPGWRAGLQNQPLRIARPGDDRRPCGDARSCDRRSDGPGASIWRPAARTSVWRPPASVFSCALASTSKTREPDIASSRASAWTGANGARIWPAAWAPRLRIDASSWAGCAERPVSCCPTVRKKGGAALQNAFSIARLT